jgi:tetratricopeptide (TPR) repeat protein
MPEEGAIDSLLEQHPAHPELLEFKIAFALSRAGERLTDEQIGLLERMMGVRPSDDAPHRRLARHYLAGETFAERVRAVEHLEFLDIREINSPAYAAELSALYAQLGDRARAFAKAERAATIAPFDGTQREQAARMALLAGDRAAAERHLLALTIIEPDRDIHRRRLEALRGME